MRDNSDETINQLSMLLVRIKGAEDAINDLVAHQEAQEAREDTESNEIYYGGDMVAEVRLQEPSTHLEPCPCCGEQPDPDECPYPANRLSIHYIVICPNPKCELEIYGESVEDARQRWNRRVDNSSKYLEHYSNAVNRIDDYLEYQYKNNTALDVRNRVLGIIVNLADKLSATHEDSK